MDVLVDHSMEALRNCGYKKFAIAGGVASNSAIRAAFEEACTKENIEFYREIRRKWAHRRRKTDTILP